MQMIGFKGSQEIARLLEKCLDWSFDIFRLEILTEKRFVRFDCTGARKHGPRETVRQEGVR